MTTDQDSLQEKFDNEIKNFINGIKGLQKKESVANEEKGVSVIKYARHFVSWNDNNKDPKAPLFLSSISIKKRGKYKITISNEFEVNQVLIEYFKNEKGILPSKEFEEKYIVEGLSVNKFSDAIQEFQSYYDAQGVKGLKIEDKSMLGYFDYSNLPMVSDLGSSEFEELFSDHELGEAIVAVDGDKIDEEIRDAYKVFPTDEEIDTIKPSEEYLILDSDSSQQLPVLAAGKGFHLIVQGPPGTGKSQTIANMISYCSSLDEPKKILFVSEKRAAIDAVLKRLNEKSLDFLILDVFKGLKASNKKEIYEEISKLIDDGVQIYDDRSHKTLDKELFEVRKKLNDLTKKIGQTNYEELEQFTSEDKNNFLEGQEELSELLINIGNQEIVNLIEEVSSDKVSEFSIENVEEIVSLVLKRNKIFFNKNLDIEFLENYLLLNENFLEHDNHDQLLENLKSISRLVQPESIELFTKLNNLFELELKNIKSIYELLNIALEINKVLNVFNSDIFSEDFESLLEEIDQFKKVQNKNAETKLKNAKNELFLKLKPFQLRKFFIAKKTIEENARNVVVAKNILTSYKFDFQKIDELTIATADIAEIFEELEGSREDIERNTNIKINEFNSLEELSSVLSKLLDSPIVSDLKQLAEIYKTLVKFNFQYFRIFDLGNKENLENITKAIILKTILNNIYQANLTDVSEYKTELIKKYSELDGEKRISQNIEQIKKQYNQNLAKAKKEYSNQALKIKTESNKRRRQANFRKILEEAEDIMLRVKPCWVMSPLVASQVLPRKELFDIVIFDEASQIQTSSAVTAIARGKKLVVAGDSKQLPPTNFFKTQLQDDFTTLTQDFDSILDVMDSIIDPMGNKQLEYHYRSKDERLITTSNISMKYNLNTIPGISNLDAIKFVKVDTDQNSDKGSNPDEVRAVCEEVSNHMLQNPDKSLVVIAFGSSHMKNIEDLFYKEYEEQSHVSKYIEKWEDTVEPFRIKNLETVQGDERDFVILSVGYGKREGRIIYNFGPINQQNGDRRLNVAASRAKEAMTVVSTITHEELLDSKMQSDGLKMFKSLLAYFKLESEAPDNEKGIAGLNAFDNRLVSKPPMNPIEQQIKRAIERLGYIVEPQYGVSGYFIDFVIAEKDLPGKWLLAVEFDGARYHSSPSARDRDRLRQRNLENLGWKFFRIWSTDWFNNKSKVLEDLEKTLKSQEEE